MADDPRVTANHGLKGVSCWGRIANEKGEWEESCWYFGPSEGARTVEQAAALWNNRGAKPIGRHSSMCFGKDCAGCMDGTPAYGYSTGDRTA